MNATRYRKNVFQFFKMDFTSGLLRWIVPLTAYLCCPVGSQGEIFTVLKDLGISDANTPYGTLIFSGTTLYGATTSGGTAGRGAVFKINTDGSSYTLLKSFDSAGPNSPTGRLLLSGNTLYGTALLDGTDSSKRGAVFKINIDGSGYAVLRHFASTNGSGPHSGLVLSGSTLYGTTYYGGVWDLGTVYKINTDGTGFKVVREFTPYDGANPVGDLALSGNVLYGTTYNSGGTNGLGGIVFRLKTDGTGFAVLKSFAYADGNHPYAGVTLSGGNLFGATYSAGAYSSGTLFKMGTNGTGYHVIHAFDLTNGANPYAALTLSGNTLYGTTYNGGTPLATTVGTVFQINTDGTGFAVLRNLLGADGTHPYAGVAVSGSTLYGTSSGGGSKYFGTIFSLRPGTAAPTITSQPLSRTNAVGTAASFQVLASPADGLSYQWRRNETNLVDSGRVSGATSKVVTLASVQPDDAGNYTVVVSNSGGSVTSSVALLTIRTPPLANADSVEVPLGLSLSMPVGTLLANDSDPNGEAIGIASIQSPSAAGCGVSMANGVVTYWGAFSGAADHFTYTLTNASGLSAVGAVNVTLTGSLPATNHLSVQPLANGSMRFVFLGVTTFRYALEQTRDLTPPQTWQRLQTNWTGARGYVFFTNTPPPGTSVYYRARWVPGL
jgi:uncharacterized repeat protein (TIGR03803 family)